MSPLLALLLAAAAQHQGHGAPPADPHAGHAAHAAPAPAPAPANDPHAGHDMPAPQPDPHAGHAPAPAADPHAGHAMPAPDPHAGHAMPAGTPAADPHAGHAGPARDPHAGHAMPAPDPHAGHTGGGAAPEAPPVAPPPAAALAGPAHAADTVFDPAAMAAVREAVRAEHGGMRTLRIGIDRLETAFRSGRDGFAWDDAHLWYGTPTDRLWLKSRGEGAYGEGVESAEIQALWSHALDPWFDLQAGVRADLRRGADRAWLALGIQGLAPYWFELDGALFLSTRGELTARVEAEYDQRLTQRLILQPAVEVELSAQDVPALGLGAGLTSLEAGLRLRYEIIPELAPYVGVQYERAFGDTARFRRAAGEDAGGWSLVLGLRAWF